MTGIVISQLKTGDAAVDDYARLRSAMWDVPDSENRHEIAELLADEATWAVFLAFVEGGTIGFLEVRLRDCADGAASSPVGYIEGWFVEPDHRMRGAGRKLVESAEIWARSHGCIEMASDAEIENVTSIRAHKRLGYGEVDRVVRFSKKLN